MNSYDDFIKTQPLRYFMFTYDQSILDDGDEFRKDIIRFLIQNNSVGMLDMFGESIMVFNTSLELDCRHWKRFFVDNFIQKYGEDRINDRFRLAIGELETSAYVKDQITYYEPKLAWTRLKSLVDNFQILVEEVKQELEEE